MISQEAIQKILGINEKVFLTPLEMLKQLNVTFYPNRMNASDHVKNFAHKFEKSLINLGVNVVPFESVWEKVTIYKRATRFCKYVANNIVWIFRRIFQLSEVNFLLPFKTITQLSSSKRIRRGICIVCVGEQDASSLPMQYISNFKTNSVISILDIPKGIDESSSFSTHFDSSMSMFAYHMTNIVIAVNRSKWIVYNFNASHPIYSIFDPEFDSHILNSIIPKVVAPISPHRFSEFIILKNRFSVNDKQHKHVISDMLTGAIALNDTGLYPPGKKIDDLPFRHTFHKLIGKLHLDNRNGMSFGYIAFQMPTNYIQIKRYDEFKKENPEAFLIGDYYIDHSSAIYIVIEIDNNKIVVKIPDVWVMTLRSGSDKTHFNPKIDLLKIGLVNGRMCMQFPEGQVINRNYKPSFDTKVILAHAVGNALVGQLSKHLGINNNFADNLEKIGISISHWHGYFNSKLIPKGIIMYGHGNPHVSCSSPQSAIYALQGKIANIFDRIETISDYVGDIHIEPHHGINISYPSLSELAKYILEHPDSTELGNKYL